MVDDDVCAVCGDSPAHMLNVQSLRGVRHRYPGSLCVPCWKKANPADLEYDKPACGNGRISVALWLVVALALVLAVLTLFEKSDTPRGYKACVSDRTGQYVDCP